MNRYFSVTTAQHAPVPCKVRQAWDWFSGTHQTAFSRPHCTKPQNPRRMRYASTSVMAVENQEENRLVRNQASEPRIVGSPCGTASGTPATAVSTAIFEVVSLMASAPPGQFARCTNSSRD